MASEVARQEPTPRGYHTETRKVAEEKASVLSEKVRDQIRGIVEEFSEGSAKNCA
jgi:hypothetical protein